MVTVLHHGNPDAMAPVRARFPDAPPDIICLDPIRNLFDGGPDGDGENDNTAMMFFLKDRVEVLREAVNPDAGVILAHHTRKAAKHQVKDDRPRQGPGHHGGEHADRDFR